MCTPIGMPICSIGSTAQRKEPHPSEMRGGRTAKAEMRGVRVATGATAVRMAAETVAAERAGARAGGAKEVVVIAVVQKVKRVTVERVVRMVVAATAVDLEAGAMVVAEAGSTVKEVGTVALAARAPASVDLVVEVVSGWVAEAGSDLVMVVGAPVVVVVVLTEAT